MRRILYIINPAAFGGQGHSAWKRFCSQWPREVSQEDIAVTKETGHAREIATTCKGYDILTAVGGDGVVNEVFSGIMDRRGEQPTLAIIPAGTGNDIALNIGINSIEDAVAALSQGHTRVFDLFRIDCQVDGQPGHRYSLLSCGIGFSEISYSIIKPWMKRLFGSKGAYCLAIAIGALSYKPSPMTVRWEDNEYNSRALITVIGNAEWLSAGAMRVSPGARMDDGELNVTIVSSQSKFSILRKLIKSAKGTHINEPNIAYFPAKKIEVDSASPIKLVIDGDVFGTTPAAFTVCPNAIQIISPKK